MKKELNYKSKRKWIVGGLAAFTSIALLTTGFATWIVGVDNLKNDNDISVTVDTASNKSVVFTMTLATSSIQLKESTTQDGKIVNVTQDNTVSNPLQIEYSNLQIAYGKDSQFDYTHIKFEIAEPGENETDSYVSVKTAENASKLSGNYQRSGTSFTYLEPPSSIVIDSLTKNELKDNIITLTSSSGTFDFKWGSFFENKSPATFYNEKYVNESDNAKLATASGEITTELKDMNKQLNGKKIKLVATLVKES